MEYLWFAIFSGRLPRDTPSCAVRCPARVHGDGLDVWVRRVRRCAADTHTPSLAMPLTISERTAECAASVSCCWRRIAAAFVPLSHDCQKNIERRECSLTPEKVVLGIFPKLPIVNNGGRSSRVGIFKPKFQNHSFSSIS